MTRETIKNFFSFSFKKILAPLALSATLSILLIITVRKVPYMSTWFGLIADTTPEWYMQSYYNTMNNLFVYNEKSQDIVILDLDENITRQDIADLLEIVSKGSPKAVGIDVTFSASKRFDSIHTANLISSIERIQNQVSCPIVYASVNNEHSIIPDSLARILNMGCVNFTGYFDYKKEINGVPHFSILLASLANYDICNIDTASFMVNYRTKDFNEYPVYGEFRSDSAYIKSFIKDKIVLIGGTNHRTDQHSTPFVVDKSKDKISGTIEIAYTLSSIVCSSYTKNDWENVKHKTLFCPYSKGVWWADIIIVLFIALYLILYIIIDNNEEKNKIIKLIKPIVLLLMVILSIVISMVITTLMYYVPDVVFLMVMTAFIGFSYDCCKIMFK